MKKIFSAIICTVLLVSMLCAPAMAIKSVTHYTPEDVVSQERLEKDSISDWAVDEVEAAYAAGIVPEFTDDPAFTDTITREQFAELIVQMVTVLLDEAPETASADTFKDSTNPNVLQAYSAKIVDGVGDGAFAPKNTTTREQIATMIYRAIKYIKAESGMDLAPKAGSLAGFTDKAKVSSWAVEGVGVLAANNIMGGISPTELGPGNSCTIEQSILLVYRTYKNAIS